MINARDIMQNRIISVTPDTDITRAGKLLLENHINGMPVVENQKLVGIIGKEDVLRTLSADV